ncbi:MAG: hypothetical protein KAJ49_10700 [Arcobacteraceae bacterium]|nr:hypothetical protein [Arcobacteraceae bacterium]
MFNKFAKVIRWSILIGMLYTLYTITIKDDVEFKGETDEKVLVNMVAKASKNKDKFTIQKQLITLFPKNEQYQKDFITIIKQQANALIDAHEKMLIPLPIGNYRYINSLEFGQFSDGNYVLIMNMSKIFHEKVIPKKQELIANMFRVTHRGMYEHFGFDNSLKLVIVPTFHKTDNITILDLNRKDKIEVPTVTDIPAQGDSK